MTADPNDVVRVYAGPLVEVEAYQLVLTEAGIESKVVGLELEASFGSAISDSVELWVRQADFDRAGEAIRRHDEERARRHHHGRPPAG